MESVVEKSAALTAQLKQAYVDVIGLLFDGVIKATPDQITHQVMVDVDTMLKEIAKCSQKMSSFGFDVVYNLTLGNAIGSIIDGFIKKKIIGVALKGTLKKWVMELSSRQQFSPCLNMARVNWKSKIALDLLDI